MNTRKSYRKFLALIGLSLALTIGSVSAGRTQQASTDFSAIDAYVSEQVNRLGIPGLALGVIQNGQIAHLRGFGWADSSGRPVTPQTPFTLGSVTKPFTALAVMQLVEAGEIDLDTPVQAYLPWFQVADPASSRQITVRHLLNQTSGMGTRDGNRAWATNPGLEEEVRSLADVRLTQPVGSAWQYNNDNFIIAGLLVETVSGQPYADYVVEHIFEPLEMRHSYADHSAALADGLAGGHLIAFGQAFSSAEVRPPAFLPTGFLMTSAEDLAHFALAQLGGGRYGEARILSPEGIAAMHELEVQKNDGSGSGWGLGWDLGEWEGGQVISRAGDTGRFRATLVLLPESRMAVVLLANASGFEQMASHVVDGIGLGVLNLLAGRPAAAVSVPFVVHMMYWGTMLTPVIQILSLFFAWSKRRGKRVWGLSLLAVLNVGLALMIVRLSTIEMPLRSLIVFFPDLGYAALAAVILAIGGSVFLAGIYLQRITRNKKAAEMRPAGGLSISAQAGSREEAL